MGTLKKVEWSTERVAARSTDEIKSLRENAIRAGETEIVALCNSELARRSPPKTRIVKVKTGARIRVGKIVGGFHFVCDREKGVTNNPDGTFWTGTWVVDEEHAERGLKISAYVALHAARSEPSYRQGVMTGWRKAPRESEYADGQPVKIESGIDFLLTPTHQPYNWVGEATGEKGYLWIDE